ncbi:hypothetical protein JMUB7511_27010 [Staphylococcus aureus]
MIQNYQKSLDTLKKLLSVMYEIKTKNVGGWFHKEKQETGNIVITKTYFDLFTILFTSVLHVFLFYEFIICVMSFP